MRATIGLLLLAVAPGFAAQPERFLPLFFFQNTGQTDPSYRFLAETPEVRAAFAPDSAIFRMHDRDVRVRFVGANPNVALAGSNPQAAKVNFFTGGDAAGWKTGLATYQHVVYRDLYPGIDMSYGGAGARIKSEFVLAPGADPNRIRLQYPDSQVAIDATGDLIVRGAGVEFREEAPVIFEETGHGRVSIEGRYRRIDASTIGFEIGPYDRTHALLIDPVISYSTYLGGSGMGAVTGVAVDSSGDLYIAGWTEAINFPIAGAVEAANQGGVDAIVAKLNPQGTALIYATYIGGSSDDRAAAIALDSSGEAYVAGSTASTNFPLVSSLRAALGGQHDGFVLKLNATGNTLLYSTYLGGSGYDTANAIAVDLSGNAYVAGTTQSADFPISSAAQSAFGGNTDAFVTKLTSTAAISYSTYLGGAGVENVGGIAIDSAGAAYVAGGTTSTNFPVVGAIQSANGGSQDAFVTKIKAGGTAFTYSTYLGGMGGGAGSPEQANGIAVDSSGDAYIAGTTNSANFPVTSSAFQSTFNGVQDAFVAKLNAAGSALVYSTYLGGTQFDEANGIAIDSAGNAYVAGYTASPEFASVGAIQAAFNGLYDSFVAKFTAAGNALSFSTLFGGSGADAANAIAVDASGNIYVGGQTSSLDLNLEGALETANNGGSIGWLMRLGVTAVPKQQPSVTSVSPASGSGNSVTFTAVYADTGGAAALTNVSLLVNSGASVNYGCYVSYSPSTAQFVLYSDVASSGSSTVLPGGGSAQNDQCTLNGSGSSATLLGNTLTLTVSLIFQPTFSGPMNVYLSATDSGATTGWVSSGAWTVTVPAPQPSNSSVSPNSGMGSSQTFTFVASDTQSATNLTDIAILFQTSVTYTNACFIVYDQVHNTVQLLYDNGSGSNSKAINSTSSLSNSQCTVGATTAQISGLSIILTINITFQGAFDGLKNIYMETAEATTNTGVQLMATYTPASGGLPAASSVVPSSGSGPAQRFSVTASDPGGNAYIVGIGVLFSSSTSTNNACYVAWDRNAGTVSVSYDIASNGATPITPGSSQIASNDQCTLRGLNTTVVYTATSVVLTLDMSFNATFSGAQNIYVLASEVGINTGLVALGSWTVTGGAPTADSVTPSSGSGSTTFTFSATDSANNANITGIAMLFTNGAPSATANACYAVYNRTNSTIGLYDNSGTVLSTKGIGSSANLNNSQCAIGYTVMNTSGNSVLFGIQIVFTTPGFDGAKSVYEDALEPVSSSGWVQRGTWTVQ